MTAEGRHPAPAGRDRPPVTFAAVARGMGWTGAGHAVSQAWWFGSLVVLAALVEPGAFGTVATGIVLVNVAALLMEAGTRGSIVAAPELDRGMLGRSLILNVGTGLVLAAAVAVLAGPAVDALASGGDPGVLRALAATIPVYGAAVVPLALLQRQMRFKRHAGVMAGASTGAAAVAILAGVLGAGVWALVLRQVLSHVIVAGLAWLAARDLLPARRAGRQGQRRRLRPPDARWFLVFALADFAALYADYLVVGAATDAARLGLYSLAFTLGFAPLTQVAWQVGRVLFPAAAAGSGDPATVARRTVRGLRLTALLLLPALAPAVVLAPTVLPAVLGDEWTDMVLPFQLLLAAGVAHALLNVVGESLSGTGGIAFRARVQVVWLSAMLPALVLMVDRYGIDGAAVAHVALFVPLAAVYLTRGLPRIGLDVAGLAPAFAGIAAAVVAQAALTGGVLAALRAAGAGAGAAAAVAAGAGLVACAAILARASSRPLDDGRRLVAALAGRVTA